MSKDHVNNRKIASGVLHDLVQNLPRRCYFQCVILFCCTELQCVILCTATRNVRPTMPLSDTPRLHYNEFTNTNSSYRIICVSSLSLPKDIHNVDRGSSVWGYYFFACFIQATVAPSRKQLIFIITQEFPFLRMLYFWFCLTTQLSASLEYCCTHEFSPIIHSSSRMNNNKSCQNSVHNFHYCVKTKFCSSLQ